jgi:hypothetical protein
MFYLLHFVRQYFVSMLFAVRANWLGRVAAARLLSDGDGQLAAFQACALLSCWVLYCTPAWTPHCESR